jgi:hypothetical protein
MPTSRIIRRRAWTAILAATVTISTSAAAQDRSSDNVHACLGAANSLGSNPHPGSDVWALAATCGVGGGRALADAFAARGSVTDPTAQIAIESALRSIQDANVFQAARNVARRSDATASMRALALRVLLAQHDPGVLISSLEGGATCRTRTAAGLLQSQGTPLPDDYAVQTDQTAKAVAADASAPADVRATANCLHRLMDAFVPRAIDPGVLTLSYVCGNRFVVRNANAEWADVTYEVAGSDDSGDLSVPPNGERTFLADAAGLTRLYFNPGHDQPRGVLVTSVTNQATSCGSGG